MSFVKQLEHDDAPAEVQRVYTAGEKTYGLVFNNWKLMAHNPRTLRGYTQFIGGVLNPEELDKRTMEMAIFKTSIINQCRYCITHHYHYAKEAGMTDEEIVAIADYRYYEGFTEREKTAIAFAEEITENPSKTPYSIEAGAISKGIQNALREHFSEVEQLELAVAVTAFNFINRFNRFMAPDIDVEMPPDEVMALLK